jgi:hypothetical protein
VRQSARKVLGNIRHAAIILDDQLDPATVSIRKGMGKSSEVAKSLNGRIDDPHAGWKGLGFGGRMTTIHHD